MPVAAVDPEIWSEIRRASETGVPDDILSSRFGPSVGAIRVKRTRQNWLTFKAVQDKAQELRANRSAARSEIACNKPVISVDAITVSAEELLRNGQIGSLRAQQIALRSLQKAPSSLPCRDAGELNSLLSAVRKPAGMDRPESAQVNVALQVWSVDTVVRRKPMDAQEVTDVEQE